LSWRKHILLLASFWGVGVGVRNIAQTDQGRGVKSLDRSSDRKARQASKIAEIRQALVSAGFDTLSKQAAVLGLSRSSAWTVLKSHHKASGLSAMTIKRMLASPHLPPAARQIVEEYIQEKLLGAYGHSGLSLTFFRMRLGFPISPTAQLAEWPDRQTADDGAEVARDYFRAS
jgi:hypothetical protein